MLGKLILFDLKASSRVLAPLHAALLLCTLAGRLFLAANLEETVPSLFLGLIFLFYFLLLFATVAITALFFIYWFYKNLFTDEGYLMHTLPAPAWMHIASKTIGMVIWHIIDTIVVGACMLILLFAFSPFADAFPALLCFELLRGDLAEEAPSPLNGRQKLLETVQGAVLSETINQTLFELCSRTAAALANRPQPNSTHVTDKAYYNIQKYYPDPKFNVSTLAEMMHFHEGYLRRIFKASFGKSPAAVLKETRMAAAKKLLEEGDMQIQQVARSVGFEDASYFSKCFKQYYGYSPSDIK